MSSCLCVLKNICVHVYTGGKKMDGKSETVKNILDVISDSKPVFIYVILNM